MKIPIMRVKWMLALFSMIILLLSIGYYWLLESQWGAPFIARHLLSNQNYSINIDSIHYSLKKPNEITLKELKLMDKKTGQLLLQSDSVTLRFSLLTLWHQGLLNSTAINNGQMYINLNHSSPPIIKTKQLQLHNMFICLTDNRNQTWEIAGFNGGIRFASLPKKQPIAFQFTTKKITTMNLLLTDIAISAFHKHKTLYVNFSSNINGGSVIGKGRRLPNKHWEIDELQVNHIYLEDEKFINIITNNSNQIPPLLIHYFAVTDSSLNLPKLKIEKANIEINHLKYDHGWQTDNVLVNFYSDSIRIHDQLFISPELKLILKKDRLLLIKEATGYWNKGHLSLQGQWQNGNLILDELDISGVHYVLPKNWLSYLSNNSPWSNFLTNLTIKALALNWKLIMDPHSTFPMQFSQFEVSGEHIQLIQDNRFGIWQGSATLIAESAVINGVVIKYPELIIRTQQYNDGAKINNQSSITFDTLIDKGILTGSLSADFRTHHLNNLQLKGQGTHTNTLISWRIVDNPPQENNFQLTLSGTYKPLTLKGKMVVGKAENQQYYPIKDNRIN